MRSGILHLAAALLALTLGAAGATPSIAAPIGYWRMEADNDPTPNGLSVANELAFGTPLTSSEARLDSVFLPVGIVPLTAATNNFSLASAFQGGSAGINASAAFYPELAVTSLTVEYWARTRENTASPFRMSQSNGTSDGILITNPNNLLVRWNVDDGGTLRSLSMTTGVNMDAGWRHYAFTYDEVTGVATFFVDAIAVSQSTAAQTFVGAPLVILAGTNVDVGVLMDHSDPGAEGIFDELRLDGTVLPASLFLVPEPAVAGLLAPLLALVLGRRLRA